MSRSCQHFANGDITSETARDLADSGRALVVAPAGCGKTWTLCRAVSYAPKPQLVLTHTHAGIRSLRRQLTAAGVSPVDYRLDTISGYARRWSASYPEMADWDPGDLVPNWDGLHEAAQRVVQRPQLSAAINRSYQGLFVDEYQDCTLEQHHFLSALAAFLPTRVFGDPMQGIFDFDADNPCVDFDTDVYPEFPDVFVLETPWRWLDTNPPLGEDLLRIREELSSGTSPDFSCYPTIDVRNPHSAAAVMACRDVSTRDGTAVAIRAHASQAHGLAKQLGGTFVSMEEAEGRDIVAAAIRIDDTLGTARVLAILDIVGNCTTTVIPALAAARARYEAGNAAVTRAGARTEESIRALNLVAISSDMSAVRRAVETLCTYPGAVLYRPEVLGDLGEAARLCGRGEYPSLAAAAVAVRDRGRHLGRRLARRVVSRTRLIKGLEFDHTIVLEPHQLDHRNLYVALTRGSRSLTVVLS